MKILLIDGNNLAHRNFHAQNLTTSTGQPTGMTYGLINSILSVQRDIRANRVIVVWDTIEGSLYRKNLYKLYKANREKKDGAFYDELSTLKLLLKALGVSQVTKPGVEADDILGYLSYIMYSDDEVYILSNDKDMLQLISNNVHVVHPEKGTYKLDSDGQVTFRDSSKDVTIRPNQIADYKALVGDTSDNYPGLTQFGVTSGITYFSVNDSADALINGTADLRGLRSMALAGIVAGRCMIPVFKKLATINMEEGKVDSPIRPPRQQDIVDVLFDQLEFKQFQALGNSMFLVGGTDEQSV